MVPCRNASPSRGSIIGNDDRCPKTDASSPGMARRWSTTPMAAVNPTGSMAKSRFKAMTPPAEAPITTIPRLILARLRGMMCSGPLKIASIHREDSGLSPRVQSHVRARHYKNRRLGSFRSRAFCFRLRDVSTILSQRFHCGFTVFPSRVSEVFSLYGIPRHIAYEEEP